MRADDHYISGALTAPWLPVETDQVTRAFPAVVEPLMPTWQDLPDDESTLGEQWEHFASYFFYEGVSGKAYFVPSDLLLDNEISAETAFWHLQCIARSYAPRHQQKMVALGMLARLWFSSVLDVGHEGKTFSFGEPLTQDDIDHMNSPATEAEATETTEDK